MTGKSAGPSTTRRWVAMPVAGSIVNSYSPEGRPGPCRGRRSFKNVPGSVSRQASVQTWRQAKSLQRQRWMNQQSWLRVHSSDEGSVHPGRACGRAHCGVQGQTLARMSRSDKLTWDLST